MAYNDECVANNIDCQRYPLFSTPSLKIKGVPIGKPFGGGAYGAPRRHTWIAAAEPMPARHRERHGDRHSRRGSAVYLGAGARRAFVGWWGLALLTMSAGVIMTAFPAGPHANFLQLGMATIALSDALKWKAAREFSFGRHANSSGS